MCRITRQPPTSKHVQIIQMVIGDTYRLKNFPGRISTQNKIIEVYRVKHNHVNL